MGYVRRASRRETLSYLTVSLLLMRLGDIQFRSSECERLIDTRDFPFSRILKLISNMLSKTIGPPHPILGIDSRCARSATLLCIFVLTFTDAAGRRGKVWEQSENLPYIAKCDKNNLPYTARRRDNLRAC